MRGRGERRIGLMYEMREREPEIAQSKVILCGRKEGR